MYTSTVSHRLHQVKFSQNRAYVKFANHHSAYKAYKSPAPIFGNRFIKVFWQKEGEAAESAPATSAPSTTSTEPQVPALAVPQGPRTFSLVNKTREEDQLAQLKELQLQKETLRKKQIEQQQQLVKMLAAPTLDQETKVTLFKQLKALTESMEASLKKDSSVMAAIAAKAKPAEEPAAEREAREAKMEDKLNTLKEKASEMMNAITPVYEGYIPRGRGMRGRGFAGGRGRGRGGFAPIPRGPLSIDNRTRVIKLDDPPAPLMDDASLRTFYQVKESPTPKRGPKLTPHRNLGPSRRWSWRRRLLSFTLAPGDLQKW